MAFRKAFDMIGNYSQSHDSEQGNNIIIVFSLTPPLILPQRVCLLTIDKQFVCEKRVT